MPTRFEVLQWLIDLRDGKVTREQASEWAVHWLTFDEVPGRELEVDDYGAWAAISTLGGADMLGWPEGYLYGPSDFSSWVDELRAAPKER